MGGAEGVEAAARGRPPAGSWEELYARSPLPVAVTDAGGERLVFANPAFAELTPVPVGELSGRSLPDLVGGPAGPRLRALLEAVREAGEAAEIEELALRARDGEDRLFHCIAWPIGVREEAPSGLVLELHDVGGRLRAEARLRRMAREMRAVNERLVAAALREQEMAARADTANRAKADFLAVVSHELRTPLTGIIGYTELLAFDVAGALNERQRDFLNRIEHAANHLLSLIEDILSYAQLEAGRDEIQWERTDVRRVARRAVELVDPAVADAGLSLQVELGECPAIVETDLRKLRQVLVNLLSNAVKYTEEGEVTLRVVAGEAEVRLEVADTGVGIPPEALERIFEPFWQIDRPHLRRAGGVGLGLSLSRRIVELLGGELKARSEPGRGSTFTVRLPRRPS